MIVFIFCLFSIFQLVQSTCDGEKRPHCECAAMKERFIDPCRSCSTDKRCHSWGDITAKGYKCDGVWLTSDTCANPPPVPTPNPPGKSECDGEVRDCESCVQLAERFGLDKCESCSVDNRCHSSTDITIKRYKCTGGVWRNSLAKCAPSPAPTPAEPSCDGETRTCTDCTARGERGGGCRWCSKTGACHSWSDINILRRKCDGGEWINECAAENTLPPNKLPTPPPTPPLTNPVTLTCNVGTPSTMKAEPCRGYCLVAHVPCVTGADCLNGKQVSFECVGEQVCLELPRSASYRDGLCCQTDLCNSKAMFESNRQQPNAPTPQGNPNNIETDPSNSPEEDIPFWESNLGYAVIGGAAALCCVLCVVAVVRLYCMSTKEASDEYVAGNELYHQSSTMRSFNNNNTNSAVHTMRPDYGQQQQQQQSPSMPGTMNTSPPPFGGIGSEGTGSYGSITMVPDGAASATGYQPTTADVPGGYSVSLDGASSVGGSYAIRGPEETAELAKY